MREGPTGERPENSFDAQWDKIARELEAEGVGANIDSARDGGGALLPVDTSPRYTDAAWALGGGRAAGPRDWSPAPEDSDFSDDDATFDPALAKNIMFPRPPRTATPVSPGWPPGCWSSSARSCLSACYPPRA